MAGQDVAGVLDAGQPLEGALEEVADHRRGHRQAGGDEPAEQRSGQDDRAADGHADHRQCAAGESFPGLAWADSGRELAASEASAGEVGADVRRGDRQQQPEDVHGPGARVQRDEAEPAADNRHCARQENKPTLAERGGAGGKEDDESRRRAPERHRHGQRGGPSRRRKPQRRRQRDEANGIADPAKRCRNAGQPRPLVGGDEQQQEQESGESRRRQPQGASNRRGEDQPGGDALAKLAQGVSGLVCANRADSRSAPARRPCAARSVAGGRRSPRTPRPASARRSPASSRR